MANNEQKTIAISTIPIPKLTVLMNNFICNTITHLNRLSVKSDEKLAEFDKKLNDLEIMTTLLEAKLNSLPEKITSTYPQLKQCSLDDDNSNMYSNQNEGSNSGSEPIPPPPSPPPTIPINQEDQKDKEKIPKEDDEKEEGEGEGGESVSPEEDLENFLKSHEQFRNVCKMLKLGVPLNATEQKARINGMDMNIFNELVAKAQKAGILK